MSEKKYLCTACKHEFTAEEGTKTCPACGSDQIDLEGHSSGARDEIFSEATIKEDSPSQSGSARDQVFTEATLKDDSTSGSSRDQIFNEATIQEESHDIGTAKTLKPAADTGTANTIPENVDVGSAQTLKPGQDKGDITVSTMTPSAEIKDSGWENYEVIDELSRGGMGIVYKARQKSLNRMVAIKVMLAGAEASEMDKKRFIREAEATAALKHPNIVDIFDIGKHEGNFYFAMEFVEGETFDSYFKRADVDQKMKLEKFVNVLEGMEFAHSNRIIHRDLKPVNIMLTKAGVPKIMDFGLAKKLKESTEDEESLSLKTATGAVMGTPHYMSPEQAGGASKEVDHRTDIFALGVIMYEMLTGVRPFRGNSINEILYSIFNDEPKRPSEHIKGLDWELEAIILKSLEKEIPRRYETVTQILDDIRAFLDGRTIMASKVSAFYLLRKKIRKNKFQSALIAMVILLVLGTGGYFTWAYIEKQNALRWAEEGVTKAYQDALGLYNSMGEKMEYPEVEAKIKATEDLLAQLEGQDSGNDTAEKTRLKLVTLNRDLKDDALNLIAGEAKTSFKNAETIFADAGVKMAYPDVEAAIKLTEAKLVQLEDRDEGNADASGLRTRIESLNKQIKAAVAENTKKLTAVTKCDEGDQKIKDAQTRFGKAKQAAEEGKKDLHKEERLEGKKLLLDGLGLFNDAYIIKPDLKRASDGRFNVIIKLAEAAREDKGYDLAILMYHQAKSIRPDDEELKAAYQETQDEANNLVFYKDQVEKGKEFLSARQWEKAVDSFKLAQEKIKNNTEIPVLLKKAEFGKTWDDARSAVEAGHYNDAIDRFNNLLTQAAEEQKEAINLELSDVKKTARKTYLAEAKTQLQNREYDKTKEFLEKILALAPEDKEASEMLLTIDEVTGMPENMVYVKGGEFKKGTSEAEANNPIETLTIESFYIGKYEVTNTEYFAFVEDKGYATKKYWDDEGWARVAEFLCSDGKTPGPQTWIEGNYPVGQGDFPVNGVSLYEARAYARWKSDKEGDAFRLCTEFEWEKAASWDSFTNSQRPYPWQGDWSVTNGNFGDNPEKVGTFKDDMSPNGSFDMGGNVTEWTEAEGRGVLRGGTFGQPEEIARIFARAFNRNIPEDGFYRSPFGGFRLACSCIKEE